MEQTRRVLRTVVQIVVGLVAALPLLAPVMSTGRAAAAYGVVVGVGAVVTRVMHSAAAAPVLRWLGLGPDGAGGGGE